MKKYEILKTIVGSQAHGLAEEGSDTDYRGVYVTPTSEILKLGSKIKGAHWMEGESEDNTAYEIGHFLHLATHCNPSILEVFKAPMIKVPNEHGCLILNVWGEELRRLFPYIWNPQGVFNAFVGYGLNQRKKMLDNHLDRWSKYGIAYLRTLKNLIDLLETGTFSLEIPEGDFKNYIRLVRTGKITIGEIINSAQDLTEHAKESLENHLNNRAKFEQKQDIEKVNQFLLTVRYRFWQ